MSTVLSTSVPDEIKPQPRYVTLPNWLREPLLHFLVLGSLLFAVDHFMFSRADDPRTIVVDNEVESQARQVFKSARAREPNADELLALRQVWLDNEVLYREGLALGVDKGDTSIRERVIFKMLSVVSADLKPPPLDDKSLREWFEKHRATYDEPARYDFQEAVLAGSKSEADMRAFVDMLNRGTPGELNAGLRVFKGRPHANIVQGYGDEFARALEESPAGKWRALSTRDGWRAVQLEAIAPARPAVFETLRSVVLQDWTDAVMAEQRTAAVRALAAKYTVKVEPEAGPQK